ncbi:helix-turn-helix domain-containing protein, partial [Methanococcoides sp. NM1]
MLKAYKYRLYPKKEQEVMFLKHIGACRFTYNWAL